MRRHALYVGLGALAMVSMGQSSCETEDASVKKGKNGGGSAVEATAQVGDKLSLKGTTYEVTRVETASEIGDSITQEKANGEFVLIEVELTNEETEPSTILSENLVLIGGNDSRYTTSDDALFAVDDALFFDEIQPGNTEAGTLVYDLPPNAVKGAILQVEDLFSDSTGQIDLGL